MWNFSQLIQAHNDMWAKGLGLRHTKIEGDPRLDVWTQNPRKHSANTEMVRHGWKISWIFDKNGYAGKIVTPPGKPTRITRFHPDRVVYEEKDSKVGS